MDQIRKVIELQNGKIFTIKFKKIDGSIRTMNCRAGVKKYLRGGCRTNNNADHKVVYDLKKQGYRTINLKEIISVHAGGMKINV